LPAVVGPLAAPDVVGPLLAVVGPLLAVVGPLLAVDGALLAPEAGALAAGAAGLAAGAAGFFWPLTSEAPNSNTAIMPGKYRCAFMEILL